MKFEVVNDKNIVVMNTTSISCIPNKQQIDAMIKAGYKFRVENKILSKKRLDEFIKGCAK